MSKPTPANRVLTAEHANGASSWQLPEVNGPSSRTSALRAAKSEQVERAAYEEAFAKGHAAGIAAGQAEMQTRINEVNKRVAELDNVLKLLARPLNEMDAEVERQLVQLALIVAKHLVRREIKADPGQIVAVIRETVALLPAAARDVRVHLHPDDAALVRERLAEPMTERAWTVIEDPVLSRGGCRVTTDTAQIDARLESRVAAAIANVLGDERIDSRETAE